jgi:hypothetical protein
MHLAQPRRGKRLAAAAPLPRKVYYLTGYRIQRVEDKQITAPVRDFPLWAIWVLSRRVREDMFIVFNKVWMAVRVPMFGVCRTPHLGLLGKSDKNSG